MWVPPPACTFLDIKKQVDWANNCIYITYLGNVHVYFPSYFFFVKSYMCHKRKKFCVSIIYNMWQDWNTDFYIYERIHQWPVTDAVFEVSYSGWNLVQWLMSRNRDWCKVFESRTVADVSYSDWRPVTVAGVKYLKIRVTRRQSRETFGHYIRDWSLAYSFIWQNAKKTLEASQQLSLFACEATSSQYFVRPS